METTAGTRDRITGEAAAAIGAVGINGLTIALVAERAGVSSALVHYHFDTKARLLVAASTVVAARRAQQRAAALSGARGIAALDALWEALEAGVRDGWERAHIELLLHARHAADVAAVQAQQRVAESQALASRLPTLFQELGASLTAAPDEVAASLDAQLDGLALALLGGREPASLRAAYDAFWLTLLAAGQSRRR